MIRHVVLFKWLPDVAREDELRVVAGLRNLGAAIPGIQRYEFGCGLGLESISFDFAVTADFLSVEDYLSYAAHPLHENFRRSVLRPILENRVAIQFEVMA